MGRKTTRKARVERSRTPKRDPNIRFGIAVANFCAIGGPGDGGQLSADLGPLNLVVGPNGAGKSSFVNALKFFGDAATQRGVRFPQALAALGGFEALVHQPNPGGDRLMMFEFKDFELDATYLVHIGPPARHPRLEFDRLFLGNSKPLITRSDDRVSIYDERSLKDEDFGAPSDQFALTFVPEDMQRFPTLTRFRQRLGGILVMELDAAALRLPSRAEDVVELRPNGQGLPRFALDLAQGPPGVWADIVGFIRVAVPQLERIVPEVDRDGGIRLYGYLAGSGARVEAHQLSAGTLFLIAIACVAYHPAPPSLWVIENVDNGIHVHLQELVMQLLRGASKRTTVVATTHSPTLVQQARSLNEIILTEASPSGSIFRHPATTPGLSRWIEEHGLASAFESNLLMVAK